VTYVIILHSMNLVVHNGSLLISSNPFGKTHAQKVDTHNGSRFLGLALVYGIV
jgi:hypothetical protein